MKKLISLLIIFIFVLFPFITKAEILYDSNGASLTTSTLAYDDNDFVYLHLDARQMTYLNTISLSFRCTSLRQTYINLFDSVNLLTPLATTTLTVSPINLDVYKTLTYNLPINAKELILSINASGGGCIVYETTITKLSDFDTYKLTAIMQRNALYSNFLLGQVVGTYQINNSDYQIQTIQPLLHNQVISETFTDTDLPGQPIKSVTRTTYPLNHYLIPIIILIFLTIVTKILRPK